MTRRTTIGPRPLRPAAWWVGVSLLAAVFTTAFAASWLAPADPFAVVDQALLPPGGAHPFGTDDLGRDVWAEVVHGAANSLRVGLVAGAICALMGLAVGGVAGVRGGAVDDVLMRATEFVQALPRFFLVITIVSLFGSSMAIIVLVIGLTAWPATARVFRAQVLAMLGRDFVLAARAAGASDGVVLVRHIAPAAWPVIAAQVSYQAGGAILAEAGLSFLGLGDPRTVSWGILLGSAQQFVRVAWWMSIFPGIAITLTVLACNLIADSTAGARVESFRS